MDKGKETIIIIAIVALVALGLLLILKAPAVVGPAGVSGPGGGGAPASSPTKAPVPFGAVAPNTGEKTSGNVAVPESVAPAAPGASSKLRTFDITAQNNEYTPNEVIVNQNDIVHINFKAVGQTYDMTLPDYGMKQVAQPGQTKIFEFQALNPGKFTFYCDLCGGLNSGVKGYIIIVPAGQ